MKNIKIALIALCLVGCGGNVGTTTDTSPAVSSDYITVPLVVVLPADYPASPATAQFRVPGKTIEEMEAYTFINSCYEGACTKIYPDSFTTDGTAVKTYVNGFLGKLTIDQFNAQNDMHWVYADQASTIGK
jgi:hypothetical protein